MRHLSCLIPAAALAVGLAAPPAALAQSPSTPGLPNYVSRVAIGPGYPDSICPGQPIAVKLAGTFPACFRVKEVQVIDLYASPFERPPIVRVVAVRDLCAPCPALIAPWLATTTIPGLLPGAWTLPLEVQLLDRDCNGVEHQVEITSGSAPFAVALTCVPGTGKCLRWSWSNLAPGPTCNAFVDPTTTADFTLAISSPVALAGLQGSFVLEPQGLRISALTATGPAAGMHMVWNATGNGAKFAMFADQAAPIPATDGSTPPPPVLTATVAWPAPGAVAPAVTRLVAADLIGADDQLLRVPQCPNIALDIRDPAARICTHNDCDINGDGYTDIRDLVAMVRCIFSPSTCPPAAVARLDCDGNGVDDINDVICCAQSLLRGPGPIGPPGPPEPAFGIEFGKPTASGAGLDIPVHITGADKIGAGRLVIEYQSARFHQSSVTLAADARSAWLCLDQSESGRVRVGLVALTPFVATNALDLVLRLALVPGAEPGGDLRVASAEFTGADGANLAAPASAPSMSLGPAGLALSPGTPNPFGRATRVLLTLPRDAVAEVSVLDPGGRLVTVLHHGVLAAGSYPFSWDGTRGDGSAAPGGLYFVRARAAGEEAVRKVVLVRGR